MLLTRFTTSQIQLFSSIFNLFKFNSASVTNIQFNLFNFKAFSINSTILGPNHEFPQPPDTPISTNKDAINHKQEQLSGPAEFHHYFHLWSRNVARCCKQATLVTQKHHGR